MDLRTEVGCRRCIGLASLCATRLKLVAGGPSPAAQGRLIFARDRARPGPPPAGRRDAH